MPDSIPEQIKKLTDRIAELEARVKHIEEWAKTRPRFHPREQTEHN